MRRVELGYLEKLAQDFFGDEKVSDAFEMIDDYSITGWEKWFQIEFSRFLINHDSEPEWWREWPAEFDGRREKAKKSCRPDFVIRKKGWRRDSYAVLEVKQHPQPGQCVNNMVVDLKKMEKIRRSSLDSRGFWVLGIHRWNSEKEMRELIEKKLGSAGFLDRYNDVVVKPINNSNYGFSMF